MKERKVNESEKRKEMKEREEQEREGRRVAECEVKNKWSPSFRVSWNQSLTVTRFPVQLWKYSCPMTPAILCHVMSWEYKSEMCSCMRLSRVIRLRHVRIDVT